MKAKLLAVSVAFVAIACATTSGVIPMGPDTFTVTGRSEFGSDKAKKAALEAAQAYAEARGLHMIPVTVQAGVERDFMGDPVATYDLVFRLVDENDPEYRRTNLAPFPDVIIQDQRGKPETAPSQYDRLRELKALLDEGVLTQSEFDEQKAKILSEK